MKRFTKTELEKAKRDERKAMREKQKQSAFMRKTLNIYNGMKKRAAEVGKSIPFTLEEFRMWVDAQFQIWKTCHYCKETLTVNKLAVDHFDPISRGGTFELKNLVASCKSCNWQKGTLSAITFKALLAWLDTQCSAGDAADIKRRLTIGGKWSFGK